MKVALFFLLMLNPISGIAHADQLQNDFKKFGQSLKGAGKEIGEKGKDLGLAVSKEAKKVGHEAAHDTKEIRAEVKESARDSGHWFTDFGHKCRNRWNSFWNSSGVSGSNPTDARPAIANPAKSKGKEDFK